MDFNDTKEQAEFRAKCRNWLEQNAELKINVEKDKKDGMVGEEAFLQAAKKWQKKKFDAGWAMLHWPKEYGGIAATPIERIIWGQEESRFSVPRGIY